MQEALAIFFQLIKNWYWVVLPYLFKKNFLFHVRFWRIIHWLKTKYKPRLLEIKFPREIKKPIRTMENVFAGIHAIFFKEPDWWEKWVEGDPAPYSFSLECVSHEGDVHFFLRCHEEFIPSLKNAIYAQYPEIELEEVDDYIKCVPPDLPKKGWGFWGCMYRMAKPDPYPIRTYEDFETEREKEKKEVVDPMVHLIEALAGVQKGEYMWLQLWAKPIGGTLATAFKNEAKEIRDALAKRQKPKTKSFLSEIFAPFEFVLEGIWHVIYWLIHQEYPKAAAPATPSPILFPPELRLTPGEKMILERVEKKMQKPVFQCFIRYLFFGKEGFYNKAKLRLIFNYFNSFTSEDGNALYPTLTAKIKKHWFLPVNLFREKRLYMRNRRLFRYYLSRDNHFFPADDPPKYRTSFILSTEELATLFHPIPWELVPAAPIKWVETKKLP